MMTRLLALAIAATGLSVGGFQLGTRQAQPAPQPEAVPSDLPADHALTVALREPSSSVSPEERTQLRKIAVEMEHAKKAAEDVRVKELNLRIAQLEQKIVNQRYVDLRLTTDVKKAEKNLRLNGKANTFKFVGTPTKDGWKKVENAERLAARQLVEKRYEDVVFQALPATVAGRVQAESRGIRAQEGERGFALLIALRERTTLGLDPKQVTQLQYLQADFLRRFAPLREESEIGLTFAISSRSLPPTKPKSTFEAVKVESIKRDANYTVHGMATTSTKDQTDQSVTNKVQGEVLYVVEVEAAKPVNDKVLRVTGQPLVKDGKTVNLPLVYSISLVKPNDVDKRIQVLKDEIDDKAYEILNDDQRKRLRRLVAISLSPQP